MYPYQVLIDVSHTWEENDIEAVTITVLAENATQAFQRACFEVENGQHQGDIKGRETFVWSVNEIDRLIV